MKLAAAAILAVLVCAVFWAFPETSHGAYPKMAKAIAVADAHWPNSPCKGRETVLYGDDALARQMGLTTLAAAWADPYTCTVWVNYRLQREYGYTWQVRCKILEHEFGHLAGYQHNNNPHSVMYKEVSEEYYGALDCWHAFPEHYSNFT